MDVALPIPHKLHNAIIGPKGKLVRSVMNECGGVRIQFPPSESKKDEVKLHGPKEDVERAKTMLLELADEQVCFYWSCVFLCVHVCVYLCMVVLICMYVCVCVYRPFLTTLLKYAANQSTIASSLAEGVAISARFETNTEHV